MYKVYLFESELKNRIKFHYCRNNDYIVFLENHLGSTQRLNVLTQAAWILLYFYIQIALDAFDNHFTYLLAQLGRHCHNLAIIL